MFRITIKDEMSKAEEMELLESIKKAIPVNSYLHSLFSNELLQSFKGSMMNDVSCDVYGNLIKSSQHDLNRVLDAQSECQRVLSSLKYQEEINDKLESKIHDLKEVIERLEEERYKAICERNRYRESLDNMIQRKLEVDEENLTLRAKLCGE